MALVVMTGFPSSGKSTIARKLSDVLEKDFGKKAHIVSENEFSPSKNELFADSKKEKELRATLKSEVQRRIGKNDVVILDAGNYIKGFRYELYCMTKENKVTQCTIHCDTPAERAWAWNQESTGTNQYSKVIFDGLVQRYEHPDSRNRWDGPLFILQASDAIPAQQIYDVLFLRKAPRPNQSTETPPVSRPDFLYDVDKVTQNVLTVLLEGQRLGVTAEAMEVPGCQDRVLSLQQMSPADLRRLRRLFIAYYKTQALDESHNVASLFVQFINKNAFS